MQIRVETIINILTIAFAILKINHIIDWNWEWILAPLWIGWIYITVVVTFFRWRDRIRAKRHRKEQEIARSARAVMEREKQIAEMALQAEQEKQKETVDDDGEQELERAIEKYNEKVENEKQDTETKEGNDDDIK